MKVFLAFLLVVVATTAMSDTVLRPVARPGSEAAAAPVTSAPVAEEAEAPRERATFGQRLRAVLRPNNRPREVEQTARAKRQALAKGAVCGDIALQGTQVGRVPGRIPGCGVSEAVRVKSVSGIILTQPAVIDCGTAKALKSWVNNGAVPAWSRTGGGLSKLKVVAHYACRTRNNQPGARISEHGKGRAIDIAAFVMRDGTEVTVLKGWRDRRTSTAMRASHKSACGPFGTVLGPNSDRFHQDHFHFDTARYRSGPYCR